MLTLSSWCIYFWERRKEGVKPKIHFTKKLDNELSRGIKCSAVGHLTTVTDTDTGTIEYVYSNTGCSQGCGGGAADKVIQEITSLGSISYTYDAIGRRTSMTVAGQPIVNYTYDAKSRLTDINTLINGVAAGFSLRYDELGRRTSLTLPNGVTTNYSYDNGSRLLNIEHLNPLNAILEKITYSYDSNGNRTSMDRLNTPVKLPNPVSNTSYNAANQQLAFGDKNIIYDANGNMETITNSCGTTTYTWDVRNRLTAINGFNADCSVLTASFVYDALGRRIQKTITRTDTVTDTMYLYEGLDIVQEIENSVVAANYIRTLNIDEPLARIKSDGTIRYYQQDALGSVISLTTENGQLATSYNYDPFGNVTISGEASDNPFQYTGRENDGTGLYYYRARYYSPELQRFISEDPIGLEGGINQFAYVGNNPVNYTDPMGLSPESDCEKKARQWHTDCLKAYKMNRWMCIASCNMLFFWNPSLRRACILSCQAADAEATKWCNENYRRMLENCKKQCK